MTESVLQIERTGWVTSAWLNRPNRRNALNRELVTALTETLQGLGEDDDTRVILLRGRGSDFCAGADLEEMERVTGEGRGASLSDARRLGDLFILMRRSPKPIIAAVHGRALAGGCGLATACDLVLARSDAELGYPEVRLGFVPAMVMAVLRLKLTENRAFELVTRGESVSAQEAERLGLVNRVLGEADFEEEVSAYARALSSRPPSALTLTKNLLYQLAALGFEEGIELGAQVNVEARQTEACQAGVREFLARKKMPGPEEGT